MNKVLSISLYMIALVVFALWAPDASAFQFYSDATNDQGGCAQCHTGFRDNNNYISQAEGVSWGTSLHNVHLNNTTIDSSCDHCHGGAGTAGRTVNIGSSLVAADGVNDIACTGCHVPEGLRAHHAVNGVTLCAGCHPNDPPPEPEYIVPPWYGSVINDIVGLNLEPCNTFGEEQLAGDTIGLDNDGDNLYDLADPDCDCPLPGTPETVCNGIDDDCDGEIDEDYQATETFCGVGVCANTGLLECQDGQLVDTCAELPQDEATDVTCDGRDGDCDGSIDEDYATVPTACGVGECAGNTGVEECQNGEIVDTCDPLAGRECEICDINSLDEDCDGIVNEGCTCVGGETRSCGSDTGECAAGIEECIQTCYDGNYWSGICVGEVGPTAEVCDNLDNDCNGSLDDNLTRPTICGVGECEGTGEETCTAGIWGNDTCFPRTPTAEVCDNLDNDCDGTVDEGGVCEPGGVDLDIARFRVSKSVKIGSEIKRIQLTVENPNGGGQDMRPATLVGMQNGVEVYNRTRMVFDLSGNGRSRFAFPSFTPAAAGVINWTVEILDDDPDDDTATASTNVK